MPTEAHLAAWFVFVRNFWYEIHDHQGCQLGPLNTFRWCPGWILCQAVRYYNLLVYPIARNGCSNRSKLLLWLRIFYCSYGAHIYQLCSQLCNKKILLCRRSFMPPLLVCPLCRWLAKRTSWWGTLFSMEIFESAQGYINPNLANPSNRTCTLLCFLHLLL